jgi:periplasmic protein TonB
MGGKMFNNLIESSSHAREFKRRGSFILFTSVTYLLLFTIAGVLSIYAYDARMDDQNALSITMLSPMDLAPANPSTTTHAPVPRANNNGHAYAVRENPTARVDQPNVAPTAISATPNTNPPVPPGVPYVVGTGNSDPGIPGGLGNLESGGGSEINGGRMPAIEVGTPPPAPIQKPVPKLVSKGVITSQAISLPKPYYPPLAKQTGTQGLVSVQVLIDESGKVISAKTISGHPLLAAAAQKAAYEARFSPTILGDRPVKVSGVITYNFVLQ